MITVLVTGVGGGVGQGIIKSLRLIKDFGINIIAADMSCYASGLYAGDYCHLLPSANHEHYFDKISDVCRKHKVSYYFPGTDVELLYCSQYASELKDRLGVSIIVSPLNAIEIAEDKFKTYSFLKEHGFDCPNTWLPDEVDLELISYPVIVKPRVGFRSIGVHLVNSPAEAKIVIDSTNEPIIQEYLDGSEFTCTAAVAKGGISDVLCLKRDLRSGDTYRAFPEKNPVIESYVKGVALALGVFGPCNFQLRVVDGVPKLFEINCRFSGTTPFCAYLGFNPVEFCLKQELGLSYKSNICVDKVILRHWCEVIVDKEQLVSLGEDCEGRVQSSVVSTML